MNHLIIICGHMPHHWVSQGDVNSLYSITKKSMGKIRKLMIYDRNERMAQRVVEIHQLKPCFVAVGAAHLGGNKGLLNLLKKQGYKIKSVEI